MRIDADIREVSVEIDGNTYPVAAKTVAVAEKLKKAQEISEGAKPQYELWLSHLEILLGAKAVRALFPDGRNENLDRMEAIYYGVMDAFDVNGRELRAARSDRLTDQAAELADALEPVTRLLALLEARQAEKKLIRREG